MPIEQNVNSLDLTIENLKAEALANNARDFWQEIFNEKKAIKSHRKFAIIDFIKFNGESFIYKAFIDIVGRAPTPLEQDVYLSKMPLGVVEEKLEILRTILLHPDLIKAGKIVKIEGLVPISTSVWEIFYKIKSDYIFFFCMIFYVHGFLSFAKLKYYFKSLKNKKLNRYDWAYLLTFVHGNSQNLKSKLIKSFFRFITHLHPQVWIYKNQISSNLVLQILVDQEVQIRNFLQSKIETNLKDNPIPQIVNDNAVKANNHPKLNSSQHDIENIYFEFENQFRGSQEMIIDRLKAYLPLIKPSMEAMGSGPALDIGFGRGEWLELLKQEGLKCVGVDFNQDLVRRTKEKGFDVFCADGIDYLGTCQEESFSLITAFHVVEHLPLEKIHQLIKNALRALKPGGTLILETPNPENIIVGSYEFWMDPTHVKPIPAPVLHFFVNAHGFQNVQTIKKNSVQSVSPDGIEHPGLANVVYRFNLERDYAILARKQ